MIYDGDDLVEPMNRAGSLEDDHEEKIGCITGARIRPPQTVKILKRAICNVESKNAEEYQIYSAPSDETPMEDSFKLNLATGQYPGMDPNNPVVLVKETAERKPGGSRSQSVVYRTGIHVP